MRSLLFAGQTQRPPSIMTFTLFQAGNHAQHGQTHANRCLLRAADFLIDEFQAEDQKNACSQATRKTERNLHFLDRTDRRTGRLCLIDHLYARSDEALMHVDFHLADRHLVRERRKAVVISLDGFEFSFSFCCPMTSLR